LKIEKHPRAKYCKNIPQTKTVWFEKQVCFNLLRNDPSIKNVGQLESRKTYRGFILEYIEKPVEVDSPALGVLP
jgi:hypothetical protein